MSNDPCPWGNRDIELTSWKLKDHEKEWLANQIINKKQTGKQLASKYKLPPRTLYRYSSDVRKGVSISSGTGRKTIFDTESTAEMVKQVQANKQMTNDEMDDLLQKELMKTNERRARGQEEYKPRYTTLKEVQQRRFRTFLRNKTGATDEKAKKRVRRPSADGEGKKAVGAKATSSKGPGGANKKGKRTREEEGEEGKDADSDDVRAVVLTAEIPVVQPKKRNRSKPSDDVNIEIVDNIDASGNSGISYIGGMLKNLIST